MDIDSLIGLAKVFHIQSEQKISLEDIAHLDIEAGDRILFHTANSEVDAETELFHENHIYLSIEAAKFLAEKKAQTIGLDYSNIGTHPEGEAVQKLLSGADIRIIEGLKLGGINEGTYDMMCLPVRSSDAVTNPSRVILKPFAA